MTIVVLGAGGMLGHVVSLYFKENYNGRVVVCARKKTGITVIDQDIHEFDLTRTENMMSVLSPYRPCVVINCVAVNIPQAALEELEKINTRFPQEVATILDGFNDGSRLVHISTDGVFRGDRGAYHEEDIADAQDPYGASKRGGEVIRPPHLTIRTSMIGPDPIKRRGLMHWFLSQSGEVKGFRRVLWNGVTSLELARFIDYAIEKNIAGVYHLGGQVLSKYDLLMHLKKLFGLDVLLTADDTHVSNRTLISSQHDEGYRVLPLEDMLQQLKDWMKSHAQIYQGSLPLK